MRACCEASRRKIKPLLRYEIFTKPEQSQPLADVPPQVYEEPNMEYALSNIFCALNG